MGVTFIPRMHPHNPVHHRRKPLRAAGGVGVVVEEGRVKSVCFNVGLVDDVQAKLAAQLIPVDSKRRYTWQEVQMAGGTHDRRCIRYALSTTIIERAQNSR